MSVQIDDIRFRIEELLEDFPQIEAYSYDSKKKQFSIVFKEKREIVISIKGDSDPNKYFSFQDGKNGIDLGVFQNENCVIGIPCSKEGLSFGKEVGIPIQDPLEHFDSLLNNDWKDLAKLIR